MVDPAFRVGLVDGDNLDERARGVADLGVKRSSCGCESQEKTGGAILVRRVILDDLGPCNRFAQLLYCDVPKKRLIDGVLGEFEFTTLELSLDDIEVNHR